MKEKEYSDIINELGNKILDLVTEYDGKLPVYEIANQFIVNATSMMLCRAPNELIGIKTILACVENGIASYEETHS